jgi:hypothetical protein
MFQEIQDVLAETSVIRLHVQVHLEDQKFRKCIFHSGKPGGIFFGCDVPGGILGGGEPANLAEILLVEPVMVRVSQECGGGTSE